MSIVKAIIHFVFLMFVLICSCINRYGGFITVSSALKFDDLLEVLVILYFNIDIDIRISFGKSVT